MIPDRTRRPKTATAFMWWLASTLALVVEAGAPGFFSLSAKDISGKEVQFDSFRGRVVLVVNVASHCGHTDSHYRGLKSLQDVFDDDDDDDGSFVTVMAFPCNQFGGQEPGSDQEIQEFVRSNYGATFPMFSKVDVVGESAHPVWKFLTDASKVVPTWNFYKYVVDHRGKVVDVFPHTTPVQDLFERLSELVREAKKARDSTRKPRIVKKELRSFDDEL